MIRFTAKHTSLYTLCALLLLFLPSPADSFANGRFLSDRIDAALIARNEVFYTLYPGTVDIDIKTWPPPVRQSVESSIESGNIFEGTWTMFIRATLNYLRENSVPAIDFEQTLLSAGNDPGTTWLLFIEFERYGLREWSERALTQLEKQMISTGAESAAIISRQLTNRGIIVKVGNSGNDPSFYFKWALRFDNHDMRALYCFSATTSYQMLKLIPESLKLLASSWRAQLASGYAAYLFLRRMVIICMSIVIILMSAKYLPRALHGFSHLYPDNMPSCLRLLLPCAVLLSTFFFGMLTFIWIMTFLIWHHFSSGDRRLFTIVLAGIMLAPFDAAIMDRFQDAINPAGAIMHLSHSSGEGNTAFDNVSDNTSRGEGLHLELAGTFNAIKSGNLSAASKWCDRLSKKYPSDMVVANLAGITRYFGGSIDSATYFFNKIIESNPRDVTAFFNLARCRIAVNDVTTGMDLIKKAATLDPVSVNGFIEANDRHFSHQWPLIRQMMFPDYTPVQFWSRIFIPYTGSMASWNAFWGLSFWGISPVGSLIIFCALLLFLLFSSRMGNNTGKFRRLHECKICGRTVCRKCTTGTMCTSCADAAHSFGGVSVVEKYRERITKVSLTMEALKKKLFSLFVPGCGHIFESSPDYMRIIVSITGSSFVYTVWYIIFSEVSFTWMNSSEIIFLYSVPCLFHVVCLIRYLPTGIRLFVQYIRLRTGQ